MDSIGWYDSSGFFFLFYFSLKFPARADSYRDDGNEEFKKKKYTIAIDNYTEGIKSKSPDLELNAVLYANRAAAQFHRRKKIKLHVCLFTDLSYPSPGIVILAMLFYRCIRKRVTWYCNFCVRLLHLSRLFAPFGSVPSVSACFSFGICFLSLWSAKTCLQDSRGF